MLESLFQGASLLSLIGIASALLSIYAYWPYARDTLAGRTQPQRSSWLVWSVLGSVALGSQIHEGATASLWFAAIQVTGTILIFTLSITRGAGAWLKRGDGCVLFAAGAGLIIWALTDTAVYALAITITISLLGGSITVIKAFHAPESETQATWLASFMAAALAMVAVGQINWVLLAYPLYLFVLNGAILVAMVLGRNRPAPVFLPRHTQPAAQ